MGTLLYIILLVIGVVAYLGWYFISMIWLGVKEIFAYLGSKL